MSVVPFSPSTSVSSEKHQEIDCLAQKVIIGLKALKGHVDNTYRSDLPFSPDTEKLKEDLGQLRAGPIIYRRNLQAMTQPIEGHLRSILKIMLEWKDFDTVSADPFQSKIDRTPFELGQSLPKTFSYRPEELAALFPSQVDQKTIEVVAPSFIALAAFRMRVIMRPREGPSISIEDICWEISPKLAEYRIHFEEMKKMRDEINQFNQPRIISASTVAPARGVSHGDQWLGIWGGLSLIERTRGRNKNR